MVRVAHRFSSSSLLRSHLPALHHPLELSKLVILVQPEIIFVLVRAILALLILVLLLQKLLELAPRILRDLALTSPPFLYGINLRPAQIL
jgi:hypothetical protein